MLQAVKVVALLGLITAISASPVLRDDYDDSTIVGATGFDASCKCVTNKVWNDVVFVVDASNATTSAGFSEMIESIITLLDPAFNVQPFGYNADVGLKE